MLSVFRAVHSAMGAITIAAVYAPPGLYVAHHGADGKEQDQGDGHAQDDIRKIHIDRSFSLFRLLEKAYDGPDRQYHQPGYGQQDNGVDRVHQAYAAAFASFRDGSGRNRKYTSTAATARAATVPTPKVSSPSSTPPSW